MKAKKIRYIKLGKAGAWWQDCKERKIIKLGYNSGEKDVFSLSLNGEWTEIKKYFEKTKLSPPTQSVNQMRDFFEDQGETLWITFEEGCLYYAFTNGEQINREIDINSGRWTSYRNLSEKGWRNTDINGNELRVEDLSGRLTKTAGYRQTICRIQNDVEEYLLNRINCRMNPDYIKAKEAKSALIDAIEPLIRLLTPSDFELLIELIFSNSGWLKTTLTGGTQKTTDLDLYNPITNKQIWVQVKSSTNPEEFKNYVGRNQFERKSYEMMYYIYHTGSIGEMFFDRDKISVWGLDYIAKQVVANGLVDWLLRKSR